jgi:hypothetical protein
MQITKKEFIGTCKIGDTIGFYNGSFYAIFSALIRLLSLNVYRILGLKLDHVALIIDRTDTTLTIAESVFMNTHFRFWQKDFIIGRCRKQTFTFDEFFQHYHNINREIKLIPINKVLTKSQCEMLKDHWLDVNKKSYKYSLVLAVLSELLPKALFRLSVISKYFKKTGSVFCSLYIAKEYRDIGIITAEEFNSNLLPSPSQFMSYSCFNNIYEVIL